MKIRITGVGNRGRDFFTSPTFDLADPLGMNLAVACWNKRKDKYDKIEVIDAVTGKEPVADPDDVFKDLPTFYARVK